MGRSAKNGIPADILDEAKANGWHVEPTQGSRLKWTNPKAARPVFSATSAGDYRSWQNHRAALRRALRHDETP